MLYEGQYCPLDASRLVFLAGEYANGVVDLSLCYCPRCDVAYVYLCPDRSSEPDAILRWHRNDGLFEVQDADRPRWSELPRPFRDAWEAKVNRHVREFCEWRSSMRVACLMDGM